ncbi:MAG: hypothetical protein Q8O99_03880 [bacterium]|nr:hypothetical protein [bacterium]
MRPQVMAFVMAVMLLSLHLLVHHIFLGQQPSLGRLPELIVRLSMSHL